MSVFSSSLTRVTFTTPIQCRKRISADQYNVDRRWNSAERWKTEAMDEIDSCFDKNKQSELFLKKII